MKVQLPWLNKASGRSAGTIYQSYWGATYTRSMPSLFHYSDTEKQQRTQAIFFDLQRVWIPIYNQLALSIKKQQRKNKNPFNMLSHFIYKIFQPFSLNKNEKYPSNFGLDPLNRVRADLLNPNLDRADDALVFSFYFNRPYNGTGFHLDYMHTILFNITKQNMMYSKNEIAPEFHEIIFRNTLDWQREDVILVYVALSADAWLGNFNLVL